MSRLRQEHQIRLLELCKIEPHVQSEAGESLFETVESLLDLYHEGEFTVQSHRERRDRFSRVIGASQELRKALGDLGLCAFDLAHFGFAGGKRFGPESAAGTSERTAEKAMPLRAPSAWLDRVELATQFLEGSVLPALEEAAQRGYDHANEQVRPGPGGDGLARIELAKELCWEFRGYLGGVCRVNPFAFADGDFESGTREDWEDLRWRLGDDLLNKSMSRAERRADAVSQRNLSPQAINENVDSYCVAHCREFVQISFEAGGVKWTESAFNKAMNGYGDVTLVKIRNWEKKASWFCPGPPLK